MCAMCLTVQIATFCKKHVHQTYFYIFLYNFYNKIYFIYVIRDLMLFENCKTKCKKIVIVQIQCKMHLFDVHRVSIFGLLFPWRCKEILFFVEVKPGLVTGKLINHVALLSKIDTCVNHDCVIILLQLRQVITSNISVSRSDNFERTFGALEFFQETNSFLLV